MQFLVVLCLAAAAAGAPAYESGEVRSSAKVPAILVDERQMSDDASSYSFTVETEDGISRSESGSALQDIGSQEGGVAQSGSYSFTLPDGQLFEMTYVADENGFQPQSSFIPVAPEFPHEVPQFVLDQVEKARLEDLDDDRRPSQPSQGYSSP